MRQLFTIVSTLGTLAVIGTTGTAFAVSNNLPIRPEISVAKPVTPGAPIGNPIKNTGGTIKTPNRQPTSVLTASKLLPPPPIPTNQNQTTLKQWYADIKTSLAQPYHNQYGPP